MFAPKLVRVALAMATAQTPLYVRDTTFKMVLL